MPASHSARTTSISSARSHPEEFTVHVSASILETLAVIDCGGETVALVVDDAGGVIGLVTDGDMRRALLRGATLESCCLDEVMRRDFVHAAPGIGRAEALDVMRARKIEHLPVLDDSRRLVGLHTLRALLASAERPNWALVLAGGKGTRLRPLTETTPKPMLTVAGRPILERLILHLMSFGIRRVFVSVNYQAEVIKNHFGDGTAFGCSIEYLHEEVPLGTGGPLSLLPPARDPVVVVNGDIVTQCDFDKLLHFHESGGYAATFGIRPYTVDIPFGVASVDGDRLVEVREKPTQRFLINAGIYVLSPEVIVRVPRGTELPITDLFAACLREGSRIGAHLVEDEWLDVGRHDELQRARGLQ